MRKSKNRKINTVNDFIKCCLFSIMASAEMCLLLFLTIHFSSIKKEILFLTIVFFVFFALILFLSVFVFNASFKEKTAFLIMVPLFFTAVQFPIMAVYKNVYPKNLDDGKSHFFADDEVMIIVPHQDDEVLLAGGIIENYIKYSSKVKVVFSTSGDYEGIGQWRMEQAIDVMKNYGVNESDVIFLGYGDDWKGETHIYNALEETEMTSYIGNKATYALNEHPAYNNSNVYTRNNFKNDIKTVVSEYKPDIIFCIDCDAHSDHIATSLLFEEALGEILSETTSYKPVVFKGFAYSCTLKAVDDFTEMNLKSTQNPYKTSYMQENNIYEWDSRVRIPVSAYTISNNLAYCGVYRSLEQYTSQPAMVTKASLAVNGDKVFWLRRTDSILYNADVTASSGNEKVLNDFKLFDTSNVRRFDKMPDDGCGIWYPSEDDEEKTVMVKFNKPHDISTIVLYDNPSLSENIICGELAFDNGETISVDKLAYNGSETVINVNQKQVQSFSFTINQSQGNFAGLSEIEAFEQIKSDNKMALVKLVNSENDFSYVHHMTKSCTEQFGLYSYNCPELSDENYSVTVSIPSVLQK